MTIASTLNRVSSDGNGVSTSFPVSFPFHAQADLIVLSTVILTGVQTTKALTTHYTISGTPDALGHYSSGGSVDFLVAPASTERITIYRDPARTQGLDLVENDNLPAESVEAALDYAIMLVQRVADLQGRSLRQPDGDSASIGTLPSKVDRALMFQAYDVNGDPIAAAGTSANLGPVTAFINTLLDDANAAAARTTLGITLTGNQDDVFRITGSADTSKQYAVEVDAITPATTRTRFIANEDSNSAQSWEVMNLSLVASVAANALTVAIKTKNGTDPSATDPIIVKFRNVTITTGDYATVALTGALSLVVSSGSTLGTVNGAYHRLYVGICNDGGTLRLCVYNPLSSASLSLAGLADDLLYASTAEGGAGAADAAQVLYSGVAFTGKAIRTLGYIESVQATAGTWATTPSKVQLMGPGVKRTGDRVQMPRNSTGAVATGATALPDDDTIPQITEGDEYITQTLTPTSAINLLDVTALLNLSHSAAALFVGIALFQDTTVGALAATRTNLGDNAQMSQGSLRHIMRAGVTTATTLRIRAGSSTGATLTINGIAGVRKYGGVMASTLVIEEIFV